MKTKNFNENNGDTRSGKLTASFITGAIALGFLIIGYQTALFIHKAAVMHIVDRRDHPDTVYIVTDDPQMERLPAEAKDGRPRRTEGEGSHAGERSRSAQAAWRVESSHESAAAEARTTFREHRKVENFVFDPNTVSVEDLQRLGFSERQAQSIDNYRKKGGRFRRKIDFAKSYVVDDSVYERLAPFINIPRIDINRADSALFETLPGIGKYFAARMVSYREQLGGYSYPEQLMDIYHFDREKYDALKDLITVRKSTCTPFPLWTASEETLAKHPYIGKYGAHGIIVYRENTPRDSLSVLGIKKAGILRSEDADRLSRCLIAVPSP